MLRPSMPSVCIGVAVLGCWGMQLFWEGGKSCESDQKRSWQSSGSPRSSLQLQPFILSGCSRCCILAEITSPSIQAAISFPPAASAGKKYEAIQILKGCTWGISDLAMKIFDLHLDEHRQGQMGLCFFLNFCPEEFQCRGYFFLNVLLLSYGGGKGKAQGQELWGCVRAETPSVVFGVLGCSGRRCHLQHKHP